VSDAPGALAVVDIDGVVADVRHRLHLLASRPKDWAAFFAAAADDPAHPEGLAVVQRLAESAEVVFLTGRPEEHRAATQRWLDAHGLGGRRLLMRPTGDRRPAAVLKVEVLAELRADHEIVAVVDDAEPVVAAVRAAGLPVFSADWEQRDATEDAALRRVQEREGRS
jgi:hypothetical protein